LVIRVSMPVITSAQTTINSAINNVADSGPDVFPAPSF